MTRLKALRDLRAAVQDDDPLKTWRTPLNADLIEKALADDDVHWSNFCGAYEGSVTDAIALAEGMLPGVRWGIELWSYEHEEVEDPYEAWLKTLGRRYVESAPTPARAMLLATLDAMVEREEGDA